tara:strand:- start:159 stop:644 length:486 start_codon:yes stop_codon:yes gene_type:complete
MPLYESIFIARQDVSAAQVDSLADGFEKIVTDNSGSVERREYWGLRTLAYRIKKNRKGHYVLFNLDAPSEAIQEMERNMSLNEDIFRFMTVRLAKLRDDASPIMQGKGDRDRDRADRGNRRDKSEEDASTELSENAEAKPNIGQSENTDQSESHDAKENEQ